MLIFVLVMMTLILLLVGVVNTCAIQMNEESTQSLQDENVKNNKKLEYTEEQLCISKRQEAI